MTDEFGDFETDDAFDREPPDPLQVAIRMHELRREIDELMGRDPGAWDDLTEKEQELALSIGTVVVNWIGSHDHPQADELAESLHNVRHYMSPNMIPSWADITEEQRTFATDLIALILDWLRRQGAID